MKRSLLLLTVLVLLLSAWAAAADNRGIAVTAVTADGQTLNLYQKSYALLVGVSRYTQWPTLEQVPAELATVKAALEKQGFKVTTQLDPDDKTLKAVFDGFIDDYGYDADNRLLFYYAGHGYTLQDGDNGYLVPRNAPDPRKDQKGFKRAALDMNDILAGCRKMDARHALFLFDSCFSGAIFKQRDLSQQPPAISQMTAQKVRQFITAGGAGESVPAKSTFTPAFVDALEYGLGDLNRDGYISGTELGLYLQNEVPRHHVPQTPQYGKINDYDLSRGDFIFVAALGSSSIPSIPVADVPAAPPAASGVQDMDTVIQQREAARKQWANWQTKMGADYDKVRSYDGKDTLTPAEKAGTWSQFLASYGSDNPYSSQDEEMRGYAQSRQSYWTSVKPAPTPAPASVRPETVPSSFSGGDSQVVQEDGTYVAYASGIVHDRKTGLEWVVGPDKGMNWNEAKAWVEGLSIGGGGWRMPTRSELKTIYKEGAGSRNMSPLFKTTAWFVWSGEPRDSSSAVFFSFNGGIEFSGYRDFREDRRDGDGFEDRDSLDGSYSGRAFAVRSR